MSELMWLVLLFAAATFFTRVVGYVLIARFRALPYRLEAALDAVPTAVIAALAIPAVINGGWPEYVAAGLAVVLSYRLSLDWVLFFGMASLIAMRQLFG